jgi:hypothetical protein
MTACPEIGALVEAEIEKVATQYRESTRLISYMRAVLGEIESAALATCAIPSKFDLVTAVGDQLSLIGKRMGFPRTHCVCAPQPVFGFSCPGDIYLRPIVGFCEDGTWIDCNADGYGDLTISDDEGYRAHLMARRYQMLGLYDEESLIEAMRSVWGATAWAPAAGFGEVVLSPGRALSAAETSMLSITLRVLPIAPGIRMSLWLGDADIFGFGDGWGGFCTTAQFLCPIEIDPYSCN